jgi:hypothetical protein
MEKYMTNEKNQRLEALVGINTGGDKKIWRRIGVAFPLKNREGFNVKLEFIPVPTGDAYEFILVEPNAKEAPKE